MDNEYWLSHNSHFTDADLFSEKDPELSILKLIKLIQPTTIIDELPIHQAGICTIAGGYQTGKTTLLKNWMLKLLKQGISPQAIVYFPCKKIDDYHQLHKLLQKQRLKMPQGEMAYIILDDITVVRDWAKALKALAEQNELNQAVLILSSADFNLKQKAHRILSHYIHFEKSYTLYPLSFRETVLLKQGDSVDSKTLYTEFYNYLIHGGNLKAINEFIAEGHLSQKTLLAYAEWINNEVERHGKQQNYLREILNATLKHYNRQISWNLLAQELTIDHPKTIGDYFLLLESMDIIFIQYALLEDKLSAAPKKARKLMFTDPFIFHAINLWLSANRNNHETQIEDTLQNPELISKFVEACVISLFRRLYPTFYIKAEGEINLAYVDDNRFWPITISWTSQIRSKDLKQILKYNNGRILTKTDRSGIIEHIKTEPLPIALWQLE